MTKEDQKKFNDETINDLHNALAQSPNHDVDNLWVGIAVGENGSEGLCAVLRNGIALPLMATRFSTLDKVRKMAKAIVENDPRQKIVIRHFSNGVDIEEITND